MVAVDLVAYSRRSVMTAEVDWGILLPTHKCYVLELEKDERD